METIEYSEEHDKWLLCLKLAQSFWLGDEAKRMASIIFLRSELLPLWSPIEVFEELKLSLETF